MTQTNKFEINIRALHVEFCAKGSSNFGLFNSILILIWLFAMLVW